MLDPMTKRLLDKRTYKVKKAAMKFYCPLCRLERAIRVSPRLSGMNYVQIGIISMTLITLTASRMGAYSLIFFFMTWASFEAGVTILFRKEVPCPYCGFDASWYKRDVKVARQKVKEFWEMEQGGGQREMRSQSENQPLPEADLEHYDTYAQ